MDSTLVLCHVLIGSGDVHVEGLPAVPDRRGLWLCSEPEAKAQELDVPLDDVLSGSLGGKPCDADAPFQQNLHRTV